MEFIIIILLIIIIIIITTSINQIDSTQIKQCKSGKLPNWAKFNDCTESPCLILRGKTITFDIEFTATDNINYLEPVLVARIFGIPINIKIPGELKDACKQLINTQCPILKGASAIYKLTMLIDNSIPKITADIDFSLVDQNKNKVFCVSIIGKIK